VEAGTRLASIQGIKNKEAINMKGLRLFFALALLTALMVGAAAAEEYYVFRNATGQMLVLDYVPAAAWTRVDGPYATLDAAKRAWGIGSTAGPAISVPTPARAGL
jgi:hypothetical protein